MIFLNEFIERFHEKKISVRKSFENKIKERDYKFFWDELTDQRKPERVKESSKINQGDILLFEVSGCLLGYAVYIGAIDGQDRVLIVDEKSGLVIRKRSLCRNANYVLRYDE